MVDIPHHTWKHYQCDVLDERTQSSEKYLGTNLSLS